ncbi:MAG: phosphatidate cytidylyltransferase [Chloroflexi bacterium]|nr:phosphatidate cytidylyltransferase [Chloroflexota bacterium]
MNNYIALVLTFALSLIFLRLMNFIAQRGWMDGKLSRKVIHIGTGPLFVLCWLMFKDTPDARWLAALVPFTITVQFALTGLGIIKDPASVQSMSRTGDPKEILRGPLYYGIMFVVLTVLFWKDSPVGIVALMMMCGGDGIADVIGRRVRSEKLPWSREKSYAGMVSVFVGGWVLSAIVLFVYVSLGIFAAPFTSYLLPLTVIALIGTVVESLPHKDVDNITVTVAAAVAGYFLF